MAWIETISPSEALGDLREIYQAIGSARGGIADIHQVQSLNPRALRAHLEIYKAIVFQRSSLSRIVRERIGVAVSAPSRVESSGSRARAEARAEIGLSTLGSGL